MKIYVKQFNESAGITILPQGDWFDLCVAKDTEVPEGKVVYVPLGVAMRLPQGFEAIVAARSSTPKKLGVICANSIGIIDNSYQGNNDEWKFPALTISGGVKLTAGTRICQFRVQPSQRASVWDKLCWLFNGKPSFEFVDDLESADRGGLGSTGTTKK